MKIFEFKTKIEDLNYYEARNIQPLDHLGYRMVARKIRVYYDTKLIGYVPSVISDEIMMYLGANTFMEIKCSHIENYEIFVVITGYQLERAPFVGE